MASIGEKAWRVSSSSESARSTATGISQASRCRMRCPEDCPSGTDLIAACIMFSAQPNAKASAMSRSPASLPEAASANATGYVCCVRGWVGSSERRHSPSERRVLKPGGHFLFNVWDRIEENVFADDVTKALAEIFPNDPPRFMARTPHGYHDTAVIRSELEEAGFSRVVIETRAEQSRASAPRIPAVAYCQGTVLRTEIEAREEGKLQAATDYVTSVIADKHGNGEVAAKIQAHVIVAVG